MSAGLWRVNERDTLNTEVVEFVSDLRKLVPQKFRPTLRSAWNGLNHRYQTKKLFGRDAEYIPPLHLMHDGPRTYREFKENGDEFLRHYVELCGLQPDEDMLDLGCGIGRKTLPLTRYMSERGSYLGMDIVKSGVEWCAEKYTREYPNFKFQLLDVCNELYNPEGRFKAAEYKLPSADEQFDFVVLNSIFTHMLHEDVENYLGEIARVLRIGGRCLISFFLLNEESLGLIDEGKSTIDLRYEFGPARAMSKQQPELAIGYDEEYVDRLFKRCGLEIRQPIAYGSWCGRNDFYTYQDQIVALKTGARIYR